MDRRAIAKAQSRLAIAKRAVDSLCESASFSDFYDNWYVFLVSVKNIYTVLEQGAKISPQSRQWFGGKTYIRKNDPLLQYLYEARNDDEHGLDSSIVQESEKYEVAVNRPGYSSDVILNGGPFKDIRIIGGSSAVLFHGVKDIPGLVVTPMDGKPVLNRYTPSIIVLVDVKARGGRVYPPPTVHLGKSIMDQSPIGISKLSIDYFEGLVFEASSLA